LAKGAIARLIMASRTASTCVVDMFYDIH